MIMFNLHTKFELSRLHIENSMSILSRPLQTQGNEPDALSF